MIISVSIVYGMIVSVSVLSAAIVYVTVLSGKVMSICVSGMIISVSICMWNYRICDCYRKR